MVPRSDADFKRVVDTLMEVTPERIYRPTLLEQFRRPTLPELRPWPYRLWCGARGHGGITPIPGPVFYVRDGFCKRCGSRVTV